MNKENLQSKIPTKWTLFIDNNWCASDFVKEMIPAYYFTELKKLIWHQRLNHLARPGHFPNLLDYCDRMYPLRNKFLVHEAEDLFYWQFLNDFFLFQTSLYKLLPTDLAEAIQKNFGGEYIKTYLQSFVEKELREKKLTEDIRNRSLLIHSLLQFTAANHSLSFILLYRMIHNKLLISLLSQTKNAKFADKYPVELSPSLYEKLFSVPLYYELPHDDLLQALRICDLSYFLLSKENRPSKIIAKAIEL